MRTLLVIGAFLFGGIAFKTEEEDFTYLRLQKNKLQNDTFVLSPVPLEVEDDFDDWPNKSFSLFMSKYGCPNGRWNIGYISFIWKTPHVMVSSTSSSDCMGYNESEGESNSPCRGLYSTMKNPTSHSNMFGPFSKYKLTLNFCQKRNAVGANGTINWPLGHYRIFGAKDIGCPTGFSTNTSSFSLPAVDTWTGHGYLPDFSVRADNDTTVLTLDECVRVSKDNGAVDLRHAFNAIEPTFMLVRVDEYEAKKELIYLADTHHTENNTKPLIQLCYYQQLDTTVCENNTSEFDIKFEITFNNDAKNHSDNMVRSCLNWTSCWALVDFGRSFQIREFSLNNHTWRDHITVMVGHDRRELLHYGGVSLLENVCHFPEGRYTLIMIKDELGFAYVNSGDDMFFILRRRSTCMFDLSITSGRITAGQISTSDNTSLDHVDFKRSYPSGWCMKTDRVSYVQVDLLYVTVVEGITIRNWYPLNIQNIPRTREFTVSYSTETYTFNSSKKFHFEMLRPNEKPQMFIFRSKIVARYIRITLQESTGLGNSCIWFELHGCLQNSSTDRPRVKLNNGIVEGSVRTFTSPQPFSNIGYPMSARHGTAYSWIFDFRDIGFVTLVIKELFLQEYEDHALGEYYCRDTIYIHNHHAFPVKTNITNAIMEYGTDYLILMFESCRPSSPVPHNRTRFSGFAVKSDTKPCAQGSRCTLSTMTLTSGSILNNFLFDMDTEKWEISVPKFTIRLNITYFFIDCFTGTKLKVSDPFVSTKEYTNCNPPPSIILTEYESVTITFKLGRYHDDNLPKKEGFRAIYSTVTPVVQLQHTHFNPNGLRRLEYHMNNSEGPRVPFFIYKACSASFMKCYNFYTGNPMSWEVASDFCWANGQNLVSIRTHDELYLIRHVLKTLVNDLSDYGLFSPVTSTNYIDPNFYTHIGISRITEMVKSSRFAWQDGTPVLFSAWNTYEPKIDGDCARMSFHYDSKNTSWEVEDCFKQLSLFFICEEHFVGLPFEDNTWNSKTYKGRLSTTARRFTCQRWDLISGTHRIMYSSYFPDETIADANNYCRDPMGEKGHLWCYTQDPSIQWDYCNIKDTISDRCYSTHSMYTGTLNVTTTGLACERWDSIHSDTLLEMMFPDKDISNAENYCRDPDDKGFLWCNTTDPYVEWEQCTIQATKSTAPDTYMTPENICPNSDLIPSPHTCNVIVDCDDAHDEQQCDYQVQKMFSTRTLMYDDITVGNAQFLCNNSEIISVLSVCDGIVDCVDATDEMNCKNDKTECSNDEFQCGDGSCIHASLTCDFIPHCNDHSDEECDIGNCSQEEYKCYNGECISIDNKCNGFIDCIDGSDDDKCEECVNQAFHCDRFKCMPLSLRCDGISDCREEEDEIGCHEYYHTCEERWLNGLTRNVAIENSRTSWGSIECNFDTVRKDGTVFSLIRAILDGRRHLAEYDSTRWSIRYNSSYHMLKELFRQSTCSQTIYQSCNYAARAVADAERMFNETYDQRCRCVAMTVFPFMNKSSYVHKCENNSALLDGANLKIEYDVSDGRYLPKQTITRTDETIEIEVGKLVCRNEIGNDVDVQKMYCGNDDNYFLSRYRCVYDTDDAGNMLGCRNGGHLRDCSTFNCPEGTVKCPDSYCISLQFVCDGVSQCPDGTDEYKCDCNNDDLEVVLVLSKAAFIDVDVKLGQFAGQFSIESSVVRMLYYYEKINTEIESPGKILLQLNDVAINNRRALKREYVCSYAMFADEFLSRLQFQNKSFRAVIFLQHDTESEEVADHMFRKIWELDFDVFRVILNSSNGLDSGAANKYKHVTDIAVKNIDILSRIGNRMFPSLCPDMSVTFCKGNYKCSSSKICISNDKICDNHVDCPLSDDEMFCDFVCPSQCSCSWYSVHCPTRDFTQNVTSLTNTFDKRLRALDVSSNKKISEYLVLKENTVNFDFQYMIRLNLSNCNISHLGSNMFSRLPNLKYLDLSYNELSTIPRRAFEGGLRHLKYLDLSYNELSTIPHRAFDVRLPNLKYLDLSYNVFLTIPRRAFAGLFNLVYLNLCGNNLFSMTHESFFGLTNLRELAINDAGIGIIEPKTFSGLRLDTLKLSNNTIIEISNDAFSELTVKEVLMEYTIIQTFDKGLFNGMYKLETLKSSAYKYCCIRPYYLSESACLPENDGVSSCKDLMGNTDLRMMLWVMGILALVANILSIFYRLMFDRHKLKQGYGFFVTNLAVADLLMGVYLLVIAVADAYYRKGYIFIDEYWRKSTWCKLAGVLSTLSSEASVMFLCLITIDRLIVIKFPFSKLKFKPKRTLIAASVVWITSLSIAVIPLIVKGYFQDQFYSRSGVCIALPLTHDRSPGWFYSVFVFIGFNFVAIIGIAVGQLVIYLEIIKVSSKVKCRSNMSRTREIAVARNLLFVVATDFLCWFPVGCMGIMAMTGYVIPGEVYAWTAIFVLPVNSALNPILYTLTAVIRSRNEKKYSDVKKRGKRTRNQRKRGMEQMIRYFSPKTNINSITMLSVEQIQQQRLEIKPELLLKVCIQLTDCLYSLHKHSMVLPSLNTSNVCISVESGKITGTLHINEHPKNGTSLVTRKENIYQLGLIISQLMSASAKDD